MFSRIRSFLFVLFVSSGAWAQNAISVFDHQPGIENQLVQYKQQDQAAPVWTIQELVDQKDNVVTPSSDNPTTREINVVKANND